MTAYGLPQPVPPQGPGTSTKKILITGDSLVNLVSSAIINELHYRGYPNTVHAISKGGSTSIDYSWIDPGPLFWPTPRDELRYWLDTEHPDVVLCNWGINVPEKQWNTPDSYLMDYVTDTAMNEVKTMCAQRNIKLLWTTIPSINIPDFYRFLWAEHMDQKIRAFGVPLVDWRAALLDENGNYGRWLTYREDNLDHEVRTSDGVHITPAGAARVARWTVQDMLSYL